MSMKTGHDPFPNRSTFTQRLTDKQEQKCLTEYVKKKNTKSLFSLVWNHKIVIKAKR